MDAQERIDKALEIAFSSACNDGVHHKVWLIDQMVRALTGEGYEKWVKKYEEPLSDDEDDFYRWDCGIAP